MVWWYALQKYREHLEKNQSFSPKLEMFSQNEHFFFSNTFFLKLANNSLKKSVHFEKMFPNFGE